MFTPHPIGFAPDAGMAKPRIGLIAFEATRQPKVAADVRLHMEL